VLALGVRMDFDYWPVLGEWTGTAAVRISL